MAQSRPRIVFTGQGYWCALLAAGVREHAKLDAVSSPLDRVADALHFATWKSLVGADVVVRVGFRPGARTWRGRCLDSALRCTRSLHRGQKSVYFWIGTDVQRTLADASAGVLPATARREMARSSHLAGAQALADELAAIGVQAHFSPHPFHNMPTTDAIPALPDRFSVLTYLPDARAEFYGSSAILGAASRLPDVRFLIMGGTRDAQQTLQLPNVEYLGWRDDAPTLYAQASCVVRLVEHDGAGGTALEGLAWGRPVIYSRAQEGVTHVAFGDEDGLVREIERLKKLSDDGSLVPDAVLADRVRTLYSPDHCYGGLATTLLEIAST